LTVPGSLATEQPGAAPPDADVISSGPNRAELTGGKWWKAGLGLAVIGLVFLVWRAVLRLRRRSSAASPEVPS
jgi:hypothetical protein